MILFVITDSYDNFLKGGWLKARNTLEDIARDACVVLHFTQVNEAIVQRLRPWAICHSGGNAPYKSYDVLTRAAYRRVVTAANVPQLGLCRGHQVLAHFFGGRIGVMRRLRPNEPDSIPSYFPGFLKEQGVYPVRILRPDALFQGCGKTIRVSESHFSEVKKLGPELICLARSQECKIQAFRHVTKPVYGVQFHPEVETEAYPDGMRVLKNFFRIARSKRVSA